MSVDSGAASAISRLTAQAATLAGTLGVFVALSGVLVSAVLETGPGFALRSIGLFLLALVAFARYLPEHLPHANLGPANRVTLARLALTALVAGCIGENDVAFAWLAAATAAIALVLDGVDGWLARRQHCVSAFGARFDMETDALLIMLLALLVWQFDKAGVWILLAGLMRYGFVAATLVLPWMRAALPPSLRRKAVCVVQGLSLLAALVPLIATPWSQAIALIGLVALGGSFLADIVWLSRNARATDKPLCS